MMDSRFETMAQFDAVKGKGGHSRWTVIPASIEGARGNRAPYYHVRWCAAYKGRDRGVDGKNPLHGLRAFSAPTSTM